jgi:enoyl-CoA hydratase/carnithine racemase
VKVVVVTGAGGNFCSGGDVHEIIGPLKDDHARAAGVHAHDGRPGQGHARLPQPIIGAIDGVCAGAGAMMALACDMRLGTAAAKTAFLFTRVGLAGADMGACALLPRMIGQGRQRAALHRPRDDGAGGLAWGFFNALHDSGELLAKAQALARSWPRARPSATP